MDLSSDMPLYIDRLRLNISVMDVLRSRTARMSNFNFFNILSFCSQNRIFPRD